MTTTDDKRQAVVAEAQAWLRTPFHHEARIKGVGVDCLMFLAEVYEHAGVIPHIAPPHYTPDWHMHRDIERYMQGLMQYAHEVEAPLLGDVALFKFGRVFSHGAIVIEWPRVIHAYWAIGVSWGDANQQPLKDREVKFFSPFETSDER